MFSNLFKKTKKSLTPNEAIEILFYGANQILESNSSELGEIIDAFTITDDRMIYANFEIIFVVHSLVRIVAINSIKPPTNSKLSNIYIDKLKNFISSLYKNTDTNELRYNATLRAEAYHICSIVSNDSNVGQSIKNMFTMILHQYSSNKENEFLSNYLEWYKNDPNNDFLKIPDFMPEINITILFNNMFKSAYMFMQSFEKEYSVS